MFISQVLKWNLAIQYKSTIQSEHVTFAGDGGSGMWREVSSGMQGKMVPHRLGWRGQWEIIDRVLGRWVRLPPGARTMGPLLSYHGSGGHLEPSAAGASTLLSQWHRLSFSPPFFLYFSRHCMSTAAKNLLF